MKVWITGKGMIRGELREKAAYQKLTFVHNELKKGCQNFKNFNEGFLN